MSSKLHWEASDTMEMPSRPPEWEYPGKAKSSAFLRHPADHRMGNTQAHTVGVGLGTGVTNGAELGAAALLSSTWPSRGTVDPCSPPPTSTLGQREGLESDQQPSPRYSYLVFQEQLGWLVMRECWQQAPNSPGPSKFQKQPKK